MNKRGLKNRIKESAQGMLEFALVLPILLLLVLGIIEAGRLLFIYSAVHTSSREAARYGSAAGDIGGYITHYEDCTGIRAAAKRMGKLVNIQDADISISYDHGPGLGAFASCPPGEGQPVNLGDRVVVQVIATYQPIIPMVRFSTFPITSITRRTIIKNVAIEGTPPAPTLPMVSFVSSGQEQSEDAGDMTVTVQLSAPTSKPVTVPFTVGGTATEGEDYTITSSPVKMTPGETSVDIVISVNDDENYEDDETVVVIMGVPTNAIKDSPNVHTARILNDDDPPQVFFSSATQSQPEDLDQVIVLQLSAPSYLDVTVNFGVSGVALGAGVDYTIASSPVVIPAGETSLAIVADVNDDPMDEDDEAFVLTIGAVDGGTKGSPDVHTATILDNDAFPLVSFTWESQSGAESVGSMIAEVHLSAVSGKEVTAPYSVSGTAQSGADYTISSSPAVIPPGELTAAITIHVIEDGDDSEEAETVVVTILAPTNALKGFPSVHTATIDTTPPEPSVYFTSEGQSSDESASGVLLIVARLSAPSSLEVRVPFTVSGTATSGGDFTITASPAVIPAGGAKVNILVTLINDSVDEYNETVVVWMGTPVNAVKGTPDVHTVTILDNDDPPQVYFTSNGQIVDEDAGDVPVQVRLSELSEKDVTVPFTLSGTAEQGPLKDYTITTSPVVVPPGSTSADVTVSVINDTLVEPSETVTLTMGVPINAALSTPFEHTVTILDNDPICPSPDSLPFFGGGADSNKLTWTLQSPNPLVSVNLTAVTIAWPTGTAANVTAITFGDPIFNGNALPPYLAVNTPSPLWSGAFNSRQMIFKFNKIPKRVTGDFYQLTATFENCPPISGIIPSD